MSGSFENSVKGATKIKLAAPKSKYVEHIFVATHAGEAGVAEVFRALQKRLRDSTWTIVFKSLIIVHLMIREGEPNVTLKFLAESPSKLAISNFTEVQVQGSNIRNYYNYLRIRAKSYGDTKVDWVRDGQGRLKRQTIDKGLLRETEIVQSQISALLKCDLLATEPENEITLTAFRLLTMDLLILFHVMNEGTINVLEHYFEMSKYDAERALNIYKLFSKQTNLVVDYLSTARSYENATRLEIPKLKHAPTSLTGALEEYLNDPDFEINRRQYLAQQKSQKSQKNSSNVNGGSSKAQPSRSQPQADTNVHPSAPPAALPRPAKPEPTGPAPDLIDLFDSIEQNQQPMATQSQPQISGYQAGPQYYQTSEQQQQQQQQQQVGFPPQAQNFFAINGKAEQQTANSLGNVNNPPFTQPTLSTQPQTQPIPGPIFSGPGLGTYPQSLFVPNQTSYPIPVQNSYSDFAHGSNQQPQSTNPFRQSVLPQPNVPSPSATNVPPLPSQPHHSTNPFARTITPQPTTSTPQSFTSATSQPQSSALASSAQGNNQFSPFQPLQSLQGLQQPQNLQPAQPLQPPQPLQPNLTGTNPFARTISPPSTTISPGSTGSTNPFRQTTFAAQNTWQANQGTIGGLEQLETVPVFPRPGQQGSQSQGQGLGWP